MGRKHVDVPLARAPVPTRRPKTLGGPLEVRPHDTLAMGDRVLLNPKEFSLEQLETPVGALIYSVAPCPSGQDESEDSVIVKTIAGKSFVVMADGAGGHPDGEKASRIAVSEIAHHIERLKSRENSQRSIIVDGFEAANERIMKETAGGLTTLLVVELARRSGVASFRTFHAGDTAALLFTRRGQVRWNTVMHSPIGYAVESGFLNPDHALHHEDLNIVSSLVGGSDFRLELGPWVTMRGGETLMIATDGLLDNIYRREMGRVLRAPTFEAAHKLYGLASQRMREPRGELSKPDDCSFVLFRA